MYPANRVSWSAAAPLFSPPDCDGAMPAPPPRPLPCGDRVGAGAHLDRRSRCHGPRRNNPARPPWWPPHPGPPCPGALLRALRCPVAPPWGRWRGLGGRWTVVRSPPPVRAPATPVRYAASSPWRGSLLPGRAWRHLGENDAHNNGVAPLETLPRSRARTRLVYPTSRAAPVCPTARPTHAPGPAAAGPRPSHWTARARQTRPVCAPVRARRRAFHALSPVGAHRWPASPPPHPHTRRPTGLEPGGEPPASVGSGACTSR